MRTHAVRCVVALAFVLSLATPALACYGSPICYSTPYYVQPYVEQKVEIKKYTVLEFVQPYFVGSAAAYVAPAAPAPAAAPAQSACEVKFTELSAKFAALEARMAAQPQYTPRPEPPQAPRPEPPPMAPVNGAAKSMFAAKCAGCHDSSVSERKGGKLSLFEFGAPLQLPAAIAEKCIEEMRRDHMPKGGQRLTAREFMAVACEIESLVAK